MRPDGGAARLTSVDWREAPASLVTPLYQVEIDRWSSALEWDASQDWQEVERGRLLGTVSGVIVTDESGAVVGWNYFLIHNRLIQIGCFVSASEACTAVMLDAVFSGPNLAKASTVVLFACTEAPGLVARARAHGLTVNRYWYLSRSAIASVRSGPPRDARPWRMEDLGATAELLARAYGPSDGSRPFAPNSTPDEWRTYVAQIATARGCGDLMLEASWCVPAGPARLGAVALVSRVGPGTGHLVQLAVDTQLQGGGVGGALLEAACGSAARAGCRRMTLLVAGRNQRARRLYEKAGFDASASFVAAGTLQLAAQPRRLTRAGLAD